ncbi:hypothetical protein [Psychroserpens algicola]|uniref:Uncharacterized protein n=1 Tax=Psychroserpens algicola TaxID=1719034 RepID=A0ABT0H3W6_9FLAO|nr:hypothetical protein [Psychroserpens algicola]MCK8479075.1 hypothetical protein [Psychroserpens algicola]
MKTKDKKNVTNKDLDKFVTQEINEVSKEKMINLFKDLKIGISVSNNTELDGLGYSDDHQKTLIIEITRYLLIHGGRLLYGGDLREKGYTRLFSDLVYLYRPTNEINKSFFINFFSFPIHTRLLKSDELDFKRNGVELVKVLPPENLEIDETRYYEPDSSEHLFIWSESLTKMRKEINSIIDAKIFIGGKLSNFKGKYPGILEEVLLALDKDIPIFLTGLFGGITKRIIQAIEGEKPEELSLEWQSNKSDSYGEFVKYYNDKNQAEKIDYNLCVSYLNGYSLKRLSENNGLTVEENKRLFETVHNSEIIFLIMKGLTNKML